MRQRLISAAVLVPVVVIVFVAGQPWLTLGIAILAALVAYETARLLQRAALPAVTWLAVPVPLLAVAAFETVLGRGRIELGWLLIAPAVGVWLIVAALPALRRADPRNGFATWAGTLFAGLYPSLLAFVVGIVGYQAGGQSPFWGGGLDPGRAWLLVLVATVWTFDSMAYLAGRFHGRGRFMYHISPAKTWSGVIGGTAAATAMCALLVSSLGYGLVLGVALGLLLAFAAQTGDLAESMLKRAAGAKDSGDLIPGHGGFLDRVDSFLFAAPALYTVLIVGGLLGAGGAL